MASIALERAQNDLSKVRYLCRQHPGRAVASTVHAQRVLDLIQPFNFTRIAVFAPTICRLHGLADGRHVVRGVSARQRYCVIGSRLHIFAALHTYRRKVQREGGRDNER